MSLLEHPIVVAIIASLVGAIIIPFFTWIWRKFSPPDIRIMTAMEPGPISRELGFTEPAIKVTVVNKSDKDITIKDIRLMFCGAFGASVAPKAPAGRSHRALPVSLASGADEHWYISAEQFSGLLRSLHHPQPRIKSSMTQVKLHTRCITGTEKVYKGSSFLFSKETSLFSIS